MHSVYRVYSLLCTLHFAICVLILAFDFESFVFILQNDDDKPCHYHAHNNMTSQHNLMTVQVVQFPLSSIYFLACMSSSAFSVAYLTVLMDVDNYSSDGVSQRVLDNLDEYSQKELLADLLFWCFLLAEIVVSTGCSTRHLASNEQLYFRCAFHWMAFYLICTPFEKRRGPNIASSVAFMVFLGLSFFTWTIASCEQPVQVMAYLHSFLDLILLLGHRWDPEPRLDTLLNCRLFMWPCRVFCCMQIFSFLLISILRTNETTAFFLLLYTHIF